MYCKNFFFAQNISSRKPKLGQNSSISKKGYVQKEIKFALEILDEYPSNEIFIIPLRLENCFPTQVEITALQWVDFYNNFEKGYNKLCKSFLLSPSKSVQRASVRMPNDSIEGIKLFVTSSKNPLLFLNKKLLSAKG